jgi:hypothetical protein
MILHYLLGLIIALVGLNAYIVPQISNWLLIKDLTYLGAPEIVRLRPTPPLSWISGAFVLPSLGIATSQLNLAAKAVGKCPSVLT